eukprot:1475705-Alexandrium_andersonii.AAC.1
MVGCIGGRALANARGARSLGRQLDAGRQRARRGRGQGSRRRRTGAQRRARRRSWRPRVLGEPGA